MKMVCLPATEKGGKRCREAADTEKGATVVAVAAELVGAAVAAAEEVAVAELVGAAVAAAAAGEEADRTRPGRAESASAPNVGRR